MGDLIRMPHSELHATIEILDRLGVTPHDFEVLRKASSWSQATVARVHKTDPSVWAALELEDAAVRLGFTPGEIRALAGRKDLLQLVRQALCGATGIGPVIGQLHILPIDRFKPFNPAEFIGAGWSIWHGPADGDGLNGEEERDHRSATLTQLDSSKIQLATCLKPNEKVMTGEERLKRLKADGRVRLNENAFKAFWENQALIPTPFKERVNGNIQFIFFDGVTLCGPGGDRYALCLCFSNGGSWSWSYDWLDRDRGVDSPSAVLAS